jgi:DNA mismatch endonuclease (patch repair protein)
MADSLTPQQRSALMARIRSKNTGPEMTVRRLVHGMGFRYRLHRKTLPGKPDLVFPGRRKVIFVHGCFWHNHPDPSCKSARTPKSHQEFWIPKLERNRLRDETNRQALTGLNWESLTIWECELKNIASIAARVRSFLET